MKRELYVLVPDSYRRLVRVLAGLYAFLDLPVALLGEWRGVIALVSTLALVAIVSPRFWDREWRTTA